ncbi:MAG: GTP cyclohydrolase I FolE2 [Euryarchaeota archaeon]|nr:GTP cyclohydrolase I FolE2 [Euryarchaeota archaeon]
MQELPDVQALAPDTKFKLTRVGISGVRKLVRVRRPKQKTDFVLTTTFDVAVDLPPTMKGSHMSRNVESISEILEKSTTDPVASLEDLCLQISKDLLRRHDYATEAQVKASADYFLERKTPFGTMSTEWYTLLAEALAKRGDGSRKLVGVKVTGTSACPCAMETAKSLRNDATTGPGLTHNQRNLVTLLVEVPEAEVVEADRLIDLVEASQSAPTVELLKRRNEGELVLRAHEHPKFVEDVVRGVLSGILEAYPKLPDESIIFVRSVSEESIHKHDAYAERETTVRELRRRST